VPDELMSKAIGFHGLCAPSGSNTATKAQLAYMYHHVSSCINIIMYMFVYTIPIYLSFLYPSIEVSIFEALFPDLSHNGASQMAWILWPAQ
jgi:hypothetical protein